MVTAAIDASDDLNFVAIVCGPRSDLEKFRATLGTSAPLHMRKIGKARRIKIAESFLRFLENRKSIRVMCLYMGIHDLRRKLSVGRIASSRLELELKTIHKSDDFPDSDRGDGRGNRGRYGGREDTETPLEEAVEKGR